MDDDDKYQTPALPETPDRKPIGFVVYEVSGTEVYPIPKGQEPSPDLITDDNLLTDPNGLQDGMRLLIHDLVGGGIGVVSLNPEGKVSCTSPDGSTLFILKFATDRQAPAPPRWVCIGSINIKALRKLEITR